MNTKKQLKQLEQLTTGYFASPYYPNTTPMNIGYPHDYCMDAVPKSNNMSESSLNERQDFMAQKMQQRNLSRYQYAKQYELLEGMLSVLTKQEQEKRRLRDRIDKLEFLIANLSAKSKKGKHRSHKSEKLCKEMAQEILKIETFLLRQSYYLGISDKNTAFDELSSDWKAYCNSKKHKAMPTVACLPEWREN